MRWRLLIAIGLTLSAWATPILFDVGEINSALGTALGLTNTVARLAGVREYAGGLDSRGYDTTRVNAAVDQAYALTNSAARLDLIEQGVQFTPVAVFGTPRVLVATISRYGPDSRTIDLSSHVGSTHAFVVIRLEGAYAGYPWFGHLSIYPQSGSAPASGIGRATLPFSVISGPASWMLACWTDDVGVIQFRQERPISNFVNLSIYLEAYIAFKDIYVE